MKIPLDSQALIRLGIFVTAASLLSVTPVSVATTTWTPQQSG